MFPPPPGAPIPGQTLIDDLSGLKVKGVATQGELNALEAKNIRRAVVKYIAGRPTRRSARFDVRWMRRLHAEMFGEVWSWAGTLRLRETNIGCLPREIETELHKLAADLREWERSGMPLAEQGVRLHHRAVAIHPFANGNGRWARLLANIWLRLHGAEVVEWPETTIGGASTVREEYLAAVRAADGGDYGPLMAMHARFTGWEGIR